MNRSPESSRVPSVEHWERLRQLFHGALGRPASDRDAYLKDACATDPTLLADVNRLFKAHDEAGSFLESPVVELLPSDDLAHSDQHAMSLAPALVLVSTKWFRGSGSGDGRSVSRLRCALGSACGRQDSTSRDHKRSGTQAAVHSRSEGRIRPQPPQHCHRLRHRRDRRDRLHRNGV